MKIEIYNFWSESIRYQRNFWNLVVNQKHRSFQVSKNKGFSFSIWLHSQILSICRLEFFQVYRVTKNEPEFSGCSKIERFPSSYLIQCQSTFDPTFEMSLSMFLSRGIRFCQRHIYLDWITNHVFALLYWRSDSTLQKCRDEYYGMRQAGFFKLDRRLFLFWYIFSFE